MLLHKVKLLLSPLEQTDMGSQDQEVQSAHSLIKQGPKKVDSEPTRNGRRQSSKQPS